VPIPAGFNPASYNSTTGTDFTLGAYYEPGDGNVYRYFKLVDAVNGTIGMVAEWASATAYNVTVDRAGGASIGRIPAGVFVAAVTAGNYCLLLVRGRHAAVKDAANALTVGVKCVPHATTDGDAAPIAGAYATTLNPFGVCLANASGGTFPCEVRI